MVGFSFVMALLHMWVGDSVLAFTMCLRPPFMAYLLFSAPNTRNSVRLWNLRNVEVVSP